jgi:hypothetical protein
MKNLHLRHRNNPVPICIRRFDFRHSDHVVIGRVLLFR